MLEPRTYSYYAYRYLLVRESAQLTFFEDQRPKEQLVIDLFGRLARERKLSTFLRDRKHLLYFVSNPSPDIYIGKLARERRYTKHDEGILDLEEIPDQEYPFVTFVVDVSRHLVLIQKRSSVFVSPNSARSALEETVSAVGGLGQYGLVLTELTPEGQFWDYVTSADGVYELALTIHGPNFFGGLYKGADIARNAQEIYKSTETTFGLKNDRGSLEVTKEVLGDIMHYISVGGGRYLIRLKKAGEQIIQTVTSSMSTVSVWIRGEAESLDLDQLMKRLSEVNRSHEKGE